MKTPKVQCFHRELRRGCSQAPTRVARRHYSSPKPQAYAQGAQISKPGSFKSSTTSKDVVEPVIDAKNLKIPENLRIYQAGKARTVFVGILKLLPLVILGTNIGLNGYAAYQNPEELYSNIPKSIAYTLLPLVYIRAAAPFVVLAYLRLPTSARTSREAVAKHAQKLPPDAQISFTTISWYGRPRRTWTTLSELRPVRSPFRLHNIRRVPGEFSSSKKFPSSNQTKFLVNPTKVRTFESTIWDQVSAQIKAKGTQK